MYKCFIIDDEEHARELLEAYAIDSGQLEIVGSSRYPMEAVKYINERKDVDITFLDIDMPQISGLAVADLIRANTSIVFTTGHSSYAVKGFDIGVSDFLLKPISFIRFLQSFNKVAAVLEKQLDDYSKKKSYFFVNPGLKGELLKIDYDDVLYIEGSTNYIKIHTTNNSHMVHLTMKEMEETLRSDIFIRIHKSFIININKITKLVGNIVMLNTIPLPIGPSYRQRILNKINDYIIKTCHY